MTGLYHYRARAYNPLWGKFLQPDPIGLDGGNNLYAYVGNDPLNLVDPSGLAGDSVSDTAESFGCGFTGGCSIFDHDSGQPSAIAGSVSRDTLDALVTGAQVGLTVFDIANTITGVGAGPDTVILAAALQPLKKGGRKSLIDQATDLIPLNSGRHRVTLRSPSQKMEVDLAGKKHGVIPTPHTKISPRNFNAPNQPSYNTKNAPFRPATQQDIRTVRRFLER